MTNIKLKLADLITAIIKNDDWQIREPIDLSLFLEQLAAGIANIDAVVSKNDLNELEVEINLMQTSMETFDALLRTKPNTLLPLAHKIIEVCEEEKNSLDSTLLLSGKLTNNLDKVAN